MKWKILFFAAAVFLAVLAARATALAAADIDVSRADSGVVTVTYSGDFTKKIKVLITRGGDRYTYDLFDGSPASFPLQMGAGTYTVSVLRNVSGDSYSPLAAQTVDVAALDDKTLYTNSIQMVDFAPDMDSIKGFAGLTGGDADIKAKLDDVYNYIVGSVSYDTAKAADITAGRITGYIPVIDDTYKTNLGICYDYSSLFAAALRYMGVPAKLEMGYCAQIDGYHAWNEVLLDGKWLKMDLTYDSAAKKYKMKYTQVKAEKDYSVIKQY